LAILASGWLDYGQGSASLIGWWIHECICVFSGKDGGGGGSGAKFSGVKPAILSWSKLANPLYLPLIFLSFLPVHDVIA